MLTKEYRPYAPDQLLILPPSLQEWLPEEHVAHFVRELVRSFDLSTIEATYEDELRGAPPYHPQMMVTVVMYAYCVGVYSSRRIEQRLHEDIAFRVLAAGNTPDFRTISDFRKRHLAALSDLFQQVLALAREAGLVKMGHVALDGTKIRAAASKHKAMSYGRMREEDQRLAHIVTEMLRRADEVDVEEDARYGPEHSGDELPEALRRAEDRLRRIREAKAALEARQRAQAETERAARRDAPRRRGRPLKPPRETPRDQDQYNFTDPDSRIMLDSQGAFIQAYNAQVAVDPTHQIIVAMDVTNEARDVGRLIPLTEAIAQNTGTDPPRLTADAGYFNAVNVQKLMDRGIDPYIPPHKVKHTQGMAPVPRGRMPNGLSLTERMRRKLQTKHGRGIYRKHKGIAEPVIGQIKGAAGFVRFLLRGLPKVRAEWTLVTTAHNIRKLFQVRSKLRMVETSL